jgi:ribonuclease P protein component
MARTVSADLTAPVPAKGRPWTTLRQRKDFQRLTASTVRRATPGFILQAAPGTADAIQVGFTASRKVGGAVQRNRARRRLRALVDIVARDAARAGTDYVLVARTETLTRSFAVMESDLRAALARINDDLQRRVAKSKSTNA